MSKTLNRFILKGKKKYIYIYIYIYIYLYIYICIYINEIRNFLTLHKTRQHPSICQPIQEPPTIGTPTSHPTYNHSTPPPHRNKKHSKTVDTITNLISTHSHHVRCFQETETLFGLTNTVSTSCVNVQCQRRHQHRPQISESNRRMLPEKPYFK